MESLSQLFGTKKDMINGEGVRGPPGGSLMPMLKPWKRHALGLSSMTAGIRPPFKDKNEISQDNFYG